MGDMTRRGKQYRLPKLSKKGKQGTRYPRVNSELPDALYSLEETRVRRARALQKAQSKRTAELKNAALKVKISKRKKNRKERDNFEKRLANEIYDELLKK